MTTKRPQRNRLPPPPAGKTILSFTGSIVSNNTDDNLREFMVNFCVEDSTFAIYEKVIPNSGFPGGKFLKETKALNPATNKPYKADDVQVGSEIVVNGWRFLLVTASEGTLKIIETKSNVFTKSNLTSIFMKMNNKKKNCHDELLKAFQTIDTKKHGKITKQQLINVLEKNQIDLGEQELIILFRKYQFAGADLFLYNDFLQNFK